MGYAISYLAVKEKKLQVLEKLALKSTGQYEEIPESPVLGAALRNGWYLVFINEYESRLVEARNLSHLSIDAEVITCMVEEHCMHSIATGWHKGTPVWSVFHKGDEEDRLTHLEFKGRMPDVFTEIEKRLRAEQEQCTDGDVDFLFDIPVELFRALTGFRYDQDPDADGDEKFEVLENT